MSIASVSGSNGASSMAGCSASHHKQMTGGASKGNDISNEGANAKTQQPSLNPAVGKNVDIAV